MNAEVAKSVASEGGISILATLARSPNRWVAEEAAGGLWNLSVGEDHKVKCRFMQIFYDKLFIIGERSFKVKVHCFRVPLLRPEALKHWLNWFLNGQMGVMGCWYGIKYIFFET